MCTVSFIIDTKFAERVSPLLILASLLAPVPPLDQKANRVRVTGLFVPLLFVSWFVTASTVFRVVTLVLGVGLFGDPIIKRAYSWIERRDPVWEYKWGINK